MRDDMVTVRPVPAVIDTADRTGRYVWFGALVLVLLAAGLGGWAATARIEGAVVAQGVFTVESQRRTVQHLEGGVVSQILARDGDIVAAGQVLMRLNGTVDEASLDAITGQMDELLARRARLLAQRDGGAAIAFPEALLDRRGDPDIRRIMAGQESLFQAGQRSRAGQIDLMRQRIAGHDEEIAGLRARIAAERRQSELIGRELVGLRELHEKGYARLTRILALERAAAEIDGRIAGHRATIARAGNNIDEINLQIIQTAHDDREAVIRELRLVEPELARLSKQRAAAADRYARIEIRAPISGTVLGLRVHTIGGVVRPGEPILDIVPADEPLVLAAQIAVEDIDKVTAGLDTRVRLSALDQRTTPEMSGEVVSVSADRVIDEATGAPYYLARIRLNDSRFADTSGVGLVPGMPAEAFIRTGERTALNYLLKPLTDSLARSFTEG